MAKKKILLVDDEADFLTVMKARLEANNYNVVTASDGNEGLVMAERENPDAILLDIMMPGIDGLSVLRKIRALRPDLPVFILTAYSDNDLKKTERELDATGLIIKTKDLGVEIKKIATAIELAVKYKDKSAMGGLYE